MDNDKIPRIPSRIRRYRVLSLLEKTGNSEVYVAFSLAAKQKMIMKLIPHQKDYRNNKDSQSKDNTQIDNIERECLIHESAMKHPYVMPIVETFDFQNMRVLLMPMAFEGTLSDFRKHRLDLSPHKQQKELLSDSTYALFIAKILYRCIKVVNFLHNCCKILHGDIKPTNIVLELIKQTNTSNPLRSSCIEPRPLFIDFGHARQLTMTDSYFCHCHNMTCTFSAPEVLLLKPHGFPSDIFALGATFVYLITGNEPISLKMSTVQMAEEMSNLSFRLKNSTIFESIPFPTSFKEMLTSMLCKCPENRPTAQQLLSHSFFEEYLGADWIQYENENVPVY